MRQFPRYACLWFVARRLRKREHGARGEPAPKGEDFVFVSAILVVTLLHGLTGYSSRWIIGLSVPVLAAALVTVIAWIRFRHGRTVRTAA